MGMAPPPYHKGRYGGGFAPPPYQRQATGGDSLLPLLRGVWAGIRTVLIIRGGKKKGCAGAARGRERRRAPRKICPVQRDKSKRTNKKPTVGVPSAGFLSYGYMYAVYFCAGPAFRPSAAAETAPEVPDAGSEATRAGSGIISGVPSRASSGA